VNIFDNPTMADNNGVERTGISLVLSFQAPWPAAHPERSAEDKIDCSYALPKFSFFEDENIMKFIKNLSLGELVIIQV